MPAKKKAARSGNPATRATAEVSSVSNFKKKRGGVFELPSGEKVQLKNPGGLSIFVKKGVIPNSLMEIVNDAISKGKDPDMSKFVGDGLDEQKMDDMLALLDAVTVECFVAPQVLPIPEDEDDRDDELLYVDEISEEDKMFVFQWVTGGTADVAQFREELKRDMAAL